MNPMNIEKYRYDLEIIRQTAAQVIKDFGMTGIEITFSGNAKSAYAELENQMVPVISKIYIKEYERFQNLLYRIDVDEKEIQKIKKNYPAHLHAQLISKLILEREFIKILCRKFL